MNSFIRMMQQGKPATPLIYWSGFTVR